MINILNEEGKQIGIEVIRFFEVDKNQYLIYSLSEKDEQGYLKLYLSKNENGFFVKVDNELEWNKIKELIKIIIREAEDNNLVSVDDLDYRRLENQTVISFRIFKLNEEISKMLGKNKREFEVSNSNVDEKIDLDSVSLEDESDEAQSYEDLLNQIKNQKEVVEQDVLEFSKEKETFPNENVALGLELQTEEENDSFNETKDDFQIDDNINKEEQEKVIPEQIPANVSALEVLLGKGNSDENIISDHLSKSEKEDLPQITPNFTVSSEKEKLEELEKRIIDLEKKLQTIKELL